MTLSQARADADLLLWAAARAGDRSAFAALYDRHSGAVYTYAFRRTGSWSQAEDITSVVFLEAWRRRVVIDIDGDSLLPWLYGVATNVIRHETRSLLRHRKALERLPRTLAEPDHADEVVGRLQDQARMQAVLDGLRSLTQIEQEAIALCVWAELSYADAAVAMQVPIGTVRSRLARAREKLRAHDIPSTDDDPKELPT